MCLTENLVSNFKKFDKSIKNSQNIMSMVVVFLAFESRNFLLSLTFSTCFFGAVQIYQFVNDDEFGMFMEIMSLHLKMFTS